MPEAEMWMGAHPLAPSRVARGSLAEVIARDPERELGAASVRAFGTRLPFLLKVLAAAEPLSIQAHPDTARARAGFEEEEKKGIPRDAAHRNYKDTSHKPELLCALTPFDALCGFRRRDETIALFDALAVKELDGVLAPLRDARDLGATFRAIMTALPAGAVDATVRACAAHRGPFLRECAWALRLARLYPGDAGVVSALLLNNLRLEPGEAIYLGAGNLHAYLEGVGVEIMASSDNVLRGGLTKKHVDVPELMRVLDFADGPVAPIRPHDAGGVDGREKVYDTPAPEFRLSVFPALAGVVGRTTAGPEILLVTRGTATLRAGGTALALARGASAYVPASTGSYVLEGDATVYRATTHLDILPRP
jgi:mannose-6-phosphate isomerase